MEFSSLTHILSSCDFNLHMSKAPVNCERTTITNIDANAKRVKMFASYGVTHSEHGVLRQSKGKVGVRPREMIRAEIFYLFSIYIRCFMISEANNSLGKQTSHIFIRFSAEKHKINVCWILDSLSWRKFRSSTSRHVINNPNYPNTGKVGSRSFLVQTSLITISLFSCSKFR